MNYYVIPGLKKDIDTDFYCGNPRITMEDKAMVIVNICSNYFGFSTKHILGEMKHDDISLVRFFCFYFIRRLVPGISLNEIGGILNRHHTTVLSGIEAIKGWFRSDDGILEKYHHALCEKLRLDADADFALAIRESKDRLNAPHSRLIKKMERQQMPKRAVGRPIGSKTKAKSVKLNLFHDENKIVRQMPETHNRPKAIYTNTNHEQALEEKVRAFAM